MTSHDLVETSEPGRESDELTRGAPGIDELGLLSWGGGLSDSKENIEVAACEKDGVREHLLG